MFLGCVRVLQLFFPFKLFQIVKPIFSCIIHTFFPWIYFVSLVNTVSGLCFNLFSFFARDIFWSLPLFFGYKISLQKLHSNRFYSTLFLAVFSNCFRNLKQFICLILYSEILFLHHFIQFTHKAEQKNSCLITCVFQNKLHATHTHKTHKSIRI
jgi:hypothetical protein